MIVSIHIFIWVPPVINATRIDNMFHFTCFNVEDPSDPSVGLIDGQLSIPGNLLREKVFDPVVSQVSFYQHSSCPLFILHITPQVLALIEDQLKRVEQPIHALLLVGGFAGSEYLKQCVEVTPSLISRKIGADKYQRPSSSLKSELLRDRLMRTQLLCVARLNTVYPRDSLCHPS